jgi:hypothetical protein
MAQTSEDRRLVRVTRICRSLPEVLRECHGRHAAFLVRKRTFVWFMDDHHGDGIVSVACKVMPGDNAALAAAHPKRFYLPAYSAHKGWVALRLDVGEPDWEEVGELIATSYRLIAPKTLVRQAAIESRNTPI